MRRLAEFLEGMDDRAGLEDDGVDRISGVIRPRHMDDPGIDADPGQSGQRILEKILEALGGHQRNDDMFVHGDIASGGGSAVES